MCLCVCTCLLILAQTCTDSSNIYYKPILKYTSNLGKQKKSLRLKEVQINTEAMRNHPNIVIRQWYNQS